MEHKSAGSDLGKAHAQGMEYIRGLIESGRDKEVPRWLIVSDFQRIAIHDLEPEQDPDLPLFRRLPPSIEFDLKDLHRNVRHFAFIAGYKHHKLNPEDPANFEATELMARLHDALYDGGYRGHELCQFLVRILFCFFAEDTGIFPPDQFKLYLRDHTRDDGGDLGARLAHLFQVLNTPEESRGKNLDEDLAQFPYVNGAIFAEPLSFADFTTAMRAALLECADFKWEKISPAVFGSLFQTIFDHEDDRKRRQLGAHYTAEKNILKLARSLFLDEFLAEFESAKADRSGRRPNRLRDLQKHLAGLKILDPACGCGNFLVITYRELRQLELEILVELNSGQQQFEQDEVYNLSLINVDQMYGIEIEEFPARIAEVALWLADHQANILLSEAFGQFYRRIPLRKSPQIHVANALQKDWKEVLPPTECSYILGNPPFIGHQWRTPEQMQDMELVWGKDGRFGRLDYVTGWYRKAADYMTPNVRCAFVSTNSISQGEQAGILWPELFQRGMKIQFAHRTFPWESEARGKAQVHCVIIGFGDQNPERKHLYDYDHDPKGDSPVVSICSNISPYLVEGPDRVMPSRTGPRPGLPMMTKGSQPTDGGHLIITAEARAQLIEQDSIVEQWIRPYMGGDDFINGKNRWCLWLKDADPSELRKSTAILQRIEAVREARQKSPTKSVRDFANTPTVFTQDRQPSEPYLAVPEVSSENRQFIPIGFLQPEIIASNKLQIIPGASLFHFGILSSTMHMAWMRSVGGRLKSDYSYSPAVYNNFPWPEEVTSEQNVNVEKAAQSVLDARAKYPTSTLADLYDPNTMPADLVKAHADLDRAVERCYRREPFPNDRARVEHLFALYEKVTVPLASAEKPVRRKKTA